MKSYEFVGCPACNGEGIIPRESLPPMLCKVCKGEGKVDWVDYAMGKRGYHVPYDVAKKIYKGIKNE